MGMYTQVRGWLNVDSIGSEENYKEIKDKLEQAKEDFLNDDILIDYDGSLLDRKWVCNDTIAFMGSNDSVYLFFGTELKNYGNPAYAWIQYLINYFPNAEGRIDFQYEEESPFYNDKSKYILIHEGKIIKEDYTDTWCEGYGNMYKKQHMKY